MCSFVLLTHESKLFRNSCRVKFRKPNERRSLANHSVFTTRQYLQIRKKSTNSPTKAIMVKAKFSIPDYVVFSLMMAVSAGIGLWYGCGPGGKQKTTKEYLLADRQMRIWPVAISLLVSYLSAITLLGVPSEIYTYGAQYYVLILSYFIICSAVAIVFVPMFHRVNVTCANEVRNSWHRV